MKSELTGRSKLFAILRGSLFWLLGFSSILALVLHLPGVIRMSDFGVRFGLPSAIVMVGLWCWGRFAKDERFLLALRLGFIGGLLGTLAYDLFRIPFHMTGSNPFAPIRVYGLWLMGGESSDWLSDLVGFLYHLSNGITFGWIYAIICIKRHWILAVIWGLGIETIAIFTAFGLVFGLRQNTGMLVLALAAHVAYGLPLGIITWKWSRADAVFFPLVRKSAALATIALTFLVTGWFLLARPAARLGEVKGEIVLGPRGIVPSWSDKAVGESLTLVNGLEDPVEFRTAGPGTKQSAAESLSIPSNEGVSFTCDLPGVTRVFAPETGARSVYVIVHRDGDYRRPTSQTDDEP